MKNIIALCILMILFSCSENNDQDRSEILNEETSLLLDDMILTQKQSDILSQKKTSKASSLEVFTKWHNCTVTYKIDQSNTPTSNQLETLFSAMEEIEAFSGVRFTYAALHAPRYTYMLVTTWDETNATGARASIGRTSKSRIEIAPTLFTDRAARHELLHILGMVHEHQRSDARDFINFHEENIVSNQLQNILPQSANEGFGTFDFGSVLLYSSFAGLTNPESCCSCNRATWTKFDGTCLGERAVSTTFSQQDKNHVNFLYPCSAPTVPGGGGNEF